MRKTKIICTMGPSTDKGDVMEQLVREGMDVARFNFSHGPHDEQRGRIQKLRELRKKYDRPVAALLDTKGPEIRLGCFKEGKVSLEEGQIFTFTNKDIEGTNEPYGGCAMTLFLYREKPSEKHRDGKQVSSLRATTRIEGR